MKTLKITLLAFAAVTIFAMAPMSDTQTELDHNHHNIVEIASDTEQLSTLVAAVQAAGLVETLSGEGPFTVFAPTNAAFDALPDGTVESLLEPENRDQLIKILTYHVVSGEVMSGDLSDGMQAETVQGSTITVDISSYGVKINDASVETADVEASNGVVHIIDSVLMPPEDSGSGY